MQVNNIPMLIVTQNNKPVSETQIAHESFIPELSKNNAFWDIAVEEVIVEKAIEVEYPPGILSDSLINVLIFRC